MWTLWRTARVAVLVAAAICGASGEARAQLGALVSPGRLSRAHADLEGATNCLRCHSAGQGVAADKCLACHAPVAQRIARKKGVHRQVTSDCVTCHVEHAGVDAELRPFDQRGFDHAAAAGFALDGLHAPLTARCSACHTTRSFLAVKAECSTCHADVHKGSLGSDCTRCHSTGTRFAAARAGFDHARTRFALTGAHAAVNCASCHRNQTYTALKFASCSDCHRDPHPSRFTGAGCSTCHTTTAWRTTQVDHTRTAFPLRGLHALVECRACHVQPALKVKPRSNTCAVCHADPHRGAFKQDCGSCHTERGFKSGTFDHATTRFPLVEKHAGLPCRACHKNADQPSVRTASARRAPAATVRIADFRGLRMECTACHDDPHRNELGAACDRCHSARTFAVDAFTHRSPHAFFEGQHAALRCEQCHPHNSRPPGMSRATMTRVGLPATSTACASCHRDVHLGQVGSGCEGCHAVDAGGFALVGFSHDRTIFPLSGQHVQAVCSGCHKRETASFPAGIGSAARLKGVATECAGCHHDVHRGEVDGRCETCHSTRTFAITRYTHRRTKALGDVFAGRHQSLACQRCHRQTVASTNGHAPVMSFRLSAECASCHEDVHRGALGINCGSCHRPDDLR